MVHGHVQTLAALFFRRSETVAAGLEEAARIADVSRMRSSNTKLSSDVEEKRARIADESRQRRLSEEAHRRSARGRGGGEITRD